jgi:hypothetical protein
LGGPYTEDPYPVCGAAPDEEALISGGAICPFGMTKESPNRARWAHNGLAPAAQIAIPGKQIASHLKKLQLALNIGLQHADTHEFCENTGG